MPYEYKDAAQDIADLLDVVKQLNAEIKAIPFSLPQKLTDLNALALKLAHAINAKLLSAAPTPVPEPEPVVPVVPVVPVAPDPTPVVPEPAPPVVPVDPTPVSPPVDPSAPSAS